MSESPSVSDSKLTTLRSNETRAAYLHVPFCSHRCGYCNFTLITGRDDLIDDYLSAIEKEITKELTKELTNELEKELGGISNRPELDTLFLGGGTPTHLSVAQLDRLFQLIHQRFQFADDYELSVEANPNDINSELIDCLASHGVNRLSLGAQSFAAHVLKTLEREHSAEQIELAVELASKQIASVSLDLIFAVPGQTITDWKDDLQRALQLPIHHISTYGLTIEKGTQFWNRLYHETLQETDEELQCAMYSESIERITTAGFEHYEVSNFAKPKHRCRHNETYWTGRPFYAFGPGAARYLNGTREVNHRSTITYIRRMLSGESPIAESETLSQENRAREQAVFGMRRLQGIFRKDFLLQTGFNLDQLLGEEIQTFVKQGFLLDDGENVRLSQQGLFISDALWPSFLKE